MGQFINQIISIVNSIHEFSINYFSLGYSPDVNNPYFRLLLLFLGIMTVVIVVNLIAILLTQIIKLRIYFIKKSAHKKVKLSNENLSINN